MVDNIVVILINQMITNIVKLKTKIYETSLKLWKNDFNQMLRYWIIASCLLNAKICCLALEATETGDGIKIESAVAVKARNLNSYSFASCPNILHHVFENSRPRDGTDAGKYEVYPKDPDMNMEEYSRSCLNACCEKAQNNTCNLIFIHQVKCYLVRCVSNEGCMPKSLSHESDKIEMILVSPVKPYDSESEESISWLNILKGLKDPENSLPLEQLRQIEENPITLFKKQQRMHYVPLSQDGGPAYLDEEFPSAEKHINPLMMNSADDPGEISSEALPFYAKLRSELLANEKLKTCILDDADVANSCGEKEECIANPKSPMQGICACIRGFTRNNNHECITDDFDYRPMLFSAAASENIPTVVDKQEEMTDKSISTTSSLKSDENKKIVVSVVSKEVRLPEKEVTLAAFTVPDEQSSDTPYKYLWTLISQPKGPMNGTISDQSKSKVQLSNLSEGLYTFKISVTNGNGAYGEAMANVTVLPEKRINRVPQVVIYPKEQVIRQPITNTVLDGSTSTDDDKITNWHWEVTSGPIGYQPHLPDASTLQLTDLMPGNYTFKLTVTDSDGMTNSTIANITVLKETDYPPVANAGHAVVLYLPNNNVTLNGTASSDDHEIVAWEWTKDASDESKAVDMQFTHKPYLQLSNLEEGMYTFVLKVTDGSNQSSSDKVHVFVKQPTNSPPKAVAGKNNTINLPRNWAVLNGSESKDDIAIKYYLWKQISGPNKASLLNASSAICNATSLTLGLYQFELSVTDENNNTATDDIWLKVVQERNAPPVANAGGDLSVTLPISALYLNGSGSSDDLQVVKYAWTREDSSLAAGIIVGNSSNEPILILTNLVQGRYVFKLTVMDDQGLTSSDTVSIIVHPDPMLMNLVQLTLPMGISVLTFSEMNKIVQKIGLLLGDMKVRVRELQYDSHTGGTILVFYAEAANANGENIPIDGFIIEHILKEKLQRDASILGAVYSDVRTTICQNKCSGHGVCDVITRACVCEAFWMPSVTYFWGWDDANCEWSILYVFVGIIVSFLLLSGIFWSLACACKKKEKPRSRTKVQKYSLIGSQDEEAPNFSRTTSLTDSETDSDVLFETRSKPNGSLRANSSIKSKLSHQGQNKYAVTRLGRKIKT